MEISTPLGNDVLLFHRMRAREEISRLSELQIDLLSLKNDIKLDDILGANVTVKLALADEGTRFFNGYVTRFSQGGTWGKYYRYHAVVHPWLWFLSRTADCRIFQDQDVGEILNKVFDDHSTASLKDATTQSYRKWTYCVQYRETDLNFVSRLMEHEGIFYYVAHDDGKHTVVLGDSYSAHESLPAGTIPFISSDRPGRADIEQISQWDLTREVQPGAYVHDDYDLERPAVKLRTSKHLQRRYKPSDYEIFDYPGHYIVKTDGEQYASARIEEYGAQFEQVRGTTNARDFRVGSLFKLSGCDRQDQNREYLITSATYDLEFSDYEAAPEQEGTSYRCSFTALSSKEPFRPRRMTPKPFVQGPQTAVVVGPGGEEICTDKYGRVKVLFHWDREGEKKKDDTVSCWLRVSYPWAGKNWGAVAIPRIGQEVIVDFLEGDPDQPIVTGRVYNADQMPPYALPANATQTGILTRSSKGGSAANCNELRFEDKKGSEQVFLHAEKNQDIEVENDETHWVGHDRKKTIDHDETTHVKHDRTETVDNNETITVHGARTETVDKDETITIHQNRTETVDKNESITISGGRTESVSKDESISIGGNRTENVTGEETVDIGKDQSISVGGNRNLSVDKDESIDVKGNRTDGIDKELSTTVGKDESRKVTGERTSDIGKDDSLKVGKNLKIDAGESVTIKTGSASITMKKDGTITIKGKDIKIEGSGAIDIKASKDIVMKGSKIKQN
jgi:type VI secretion system secreted protein VgrG